MELMTAAWRESARVGDAEVQLEHVVAGILAAGGPAARLAARHGLGVPEIRAGVRDARRARLARLGIEPLAVRQQPRSFEQIDTDEIGDVSISDTVMAMIRALPGRFTDIDLLVACLDEKGGTGADAVRHAGADPEVLRAAALAPEWRAAPSGAARPVQVPEDLRSADLPLHAVALERFVAVPIATVARVLSDPELAAGWLAGGARVTGDGGVIAEGTNRRGTMITTYRHTSRTPVPGTSVRGVWSLTVDVPSRELKGEPSGALDVRLAERDGGTVVQFVQVSRLWGRLGRVGAPVIQRLTRFGLRWKMQAFVYLCAEHAEPRETDPS